MRPEMPFHTTTTSETADCGLRDTLDVITQNLSVTLGASLPSPFPPYHVQTYCIYQVLAVECFHWVFLRLFKHKEQLEHCDVTC
ncbi:hypothetical protein DPMN_020255 [Dreissena polymorpha]|uniref:Uncharacterized protein n=1 Tax=Dreissena polymorpha TaxID=45954 RepID=A0A9D4NMB4_DREPO|nr:hypothetical protein DPMN_020255 [Dreissena polymorpha]